MNPQSLLFIHTHKRFNFNHDSAWVKLTGYEKDLDIGCDYLCLENFENNVRNLLPDGEKYDNKRVGYLFQTIATEYWVLKYLKDVKYIGISGYRRYPFFRYSRADQQPTLNIQASDENLEVLTSPENLAVIEKILGVYDVIIPKRIHFPCSVADQFIQAHKIPEIWFLFIACIAEVAPEYKSKLGWFDMAFSANYCGPMGMNPLGLFKEYSDTYFKILSMVLKNCSDPWALSDPNAPITHISDRWMGFLAERFYPFFLFANKISTFEVQGTLLV